MFSFKKLTVPEKNTTKEVEVVQTWRVDWLGRNGSFSGDTQKETEIFTNEQEAKDFEQSLINAFKLIRNTSERYSVSRSKSK